jgi:hypothetical protein
MVKGDFMKHRLLRMVAATPLLVAMSLPAGTFHSTAMPTAGHYLATAASQRAVPARKRHVKRRSKKKSAAIVGGSTLGGAALGGLVGGKKGAAVGAAAGAGGGYVYDRKSQHKPVVPK